MEKVKTRFYGFDQNNSGGYFVEDNGAGVCEYVIIEAQNAGEAWDRLEKIGDKVKGFWDSCSCCGERWSNWLDENDGKNVPMIYDEPIDQAKGSSYRTRSFVHYYDGRVKEFKLKQLDVK